MDIVMAMQTVMPMVMPMDASAPMELPQMVTFLKLRNLLVCERGN